MNYDGFAPTISTWRGACFLSVLFSLILFFPFLLQLIICFHVTYSLPDIIQEIAKEDEDKHKRHLRRVVSKQERLKSRPPRFGKHKYGSFLAKI